MKNKIINYFNLKIIFIYIKMIGTVVYRLITPKIFTRIEVASNAKIIQLKKIIEERTQISPNAQKLYLDKSFTKK